MIKNWLASYPRDIPDTVEIDPAVSLRDIIEQACERYADKPAFSNLGTVIDYHQMETLSRNFAAYLQHDGLRKGDRIALMMPNLLQYPVAFFAAQRAGLVVVNVNPMYTSEELALQLRDSGARAIVILENFATTLQPILPQLKLDRVILTRVGDLLGPLKGSAVNAVVKYLKKAVPAFHLPGTVAFRQVLHEGKNHPLAPIPLDGSDTALLQYTGGTTGTAKGAVISHRNLVANIRQLSAWLSIVARPGAETVVTALPLYHIFSLTANCLLFSHLGGHNLLITDPRDRRGFVRELKRFPFTAMSGVDTLFNALLHTPGFSELDFSRLHITLGGGMAIQPRVAEQWQQLTGSTLIQAYGLTEASPGVCIDPMDATEFNGSVGLPLPSTELVIRDPQGSAVAEGENGEVWIRGPQVIRQYWQRDQETRLVLNQDGWLRTGDIGYMDAAGYVYLVDREKDLILVSGFNVYPHEVEEVATQHPEVCEAAAIGVPDPSTGERVKLFVVREPTAAAQALDQATLLAFCREHLARYKIPHSIEFRDQLPKSNVGKVLRRELRLEQQRERASQDTL